jgi:hypothetical protein
LEISPAAAAAAAAIMLRYTIILGNGTKEEERAKGES